MGKPKIAVLMGGRSLEREISLHSGRRVSGALQDLGYRVLDVDVDEGLVSLLKRERPDLAFVALHGKYGEDGSVQELLEMLRVPYTGPGVLASILGFDKVISKELFREEGVPTPRFYALSAGTLREMGAAGAFPEIIRDLGIPLVVKPAAQGSALGIKFVRAREELAPALLAALSYDEKVLLEEYVEGTEVAASVLGNENPEVLPLVEIHPHQGWYNFEARYTSGRCDYYVPARLSPETAERVRELTLKIFRLFDCRGVSRVDMIVRDGEPQVLEINTSPGLTETSLLPMAAVAAGIDFPQLVERIVQLAL